MRIRVVLASNFFTELLKMSYCRITLRKELEEKELQHNGIFEHIESDVRYISSDYTSF